MSPEDPNEPASAPKWQRLPGPIHLKLTHLIAEHLRTHGSARYEDLRDRPAFAPWFGSHLGHRGEKRFDRLVKSVKRNQPRKTARRSTSDPSHFEEPLSPREDRSDPS